MGFLDSFKDPLDLTGQKASETATNLQIGLSDQALALQEEFFDILRADAAPVRDTRNLAIDKISGLGENGLSVDPRFEFARQEQEEGLNKSFAARGKFGSGGRLKSLQNLNASAASTGTQDGLNRLLGLAGFQTRDLTNQNSLIQNNINQQSNALQFQGNVNAAGRTSRYNGLIDLANNFGQAVA